MYNIYFWHRFDLANAINDYKQLCSSAVNSQILCSQKAGVECAYLRYMIYIYYYDFYQSVTKHFKMSGIYSIYLFISRFTITIKSYW